MSEVSSLAQNLCFFYGKLCKLGDFFLSLCYKTPHKSSNVTLL